MASCSVPDNDRNATGDNYYENFLNDSQRNYFWNTYGFIKQHWQNGWGADNTTHPDGDSPLARTYNACWALTYSAVDYGNDNYDSTTILNWARRYVRSKMKDLRAGCGSNPNAIATTFGHDNTTLYLNFFYGSSVIERAAVLLHESRHYDIGHNADFPADSGIPNTPANKGQADSNWDYNGAYHYEVAYLSWYHNVAPGASVAMRARARQRANWCLDNAFATDPGWRINEWDAPQSGWRWCGKCQSLCFAGFGQIGHCAAGGAHNHGGSWNLPLIHGTYAPAQSGWKYCNKCQMLSFANNADQGPCPSGGKHEHSGSWDFALLWGGNNSGTQRQWKWCSKCQGMGYSPNGGGKCPAGGAHNYSGGEYSLPAITDDVYPNSQEGWRWCNKCQGLQYAPNGGGVCPAGGKHNNVQSWNYTMLFDAPAWGQTGWKWCRKCQGMAYGGGAPGTCPAGAKHDHSGSANYIMQHDTINMGQEGWRWCSKCQGLHYSLFNGGVCPAGGNHLHQSYAYGLPFTT